MTTANVYSMTDVALEAELSYLEDHDCDYSDWCPSCKLALKIEKEIDARDLWNDSDARVRESVGNYS